MNSDFTEMEFTGERFVPTEQGKIRLEHYHRYAMATEIIRDRDVLDVASGEGYGSFLMAAFARTVTGVDIASEAVESAITKYSHRKNLHFQQGNAALLEFPDASFDVVTSFETIEHLYEQEEMLSEMYRVLRPEGILVISSPNKPVYDDELGADNEFHVKELTFEEFDYLLRSRFGTIQYYGQRALAGSVIKELHSTGSELRVWSDNGERIHQGIDTILSQPVYFIAICSKDKSPLPTISSSVFYPEVGDPLRQSESTIVELAGTVESLVLDRNAQKNGAAQLKEILAEKSAVLEHAQEAINALIIDRDASKSGLKELEQAYHDLSHDRNLKIEQLNQKLIDSNARLEDLEKAYRDISHDRNLKIELLNQKLIDSNARLEDLEKAYRDITQDSNRNIEQLSKRLLDLSARLKERDIRIEAQAKSLLELMNELAAHKKIAQSFAALHQTASENLNQILRSHSWRITKPFRFISRLIHGDLHGARRSIATFLGKTVTPVSTSKSMLEPQPVSLPQIQHANNSQSVEPLHNGHRILLVSYYCPTRAHAGGLRILDIYHLIRKHYPSSILDLYTHSRPSIDWEYTDANNIFDRIYFSPYEELSPQHLAIEIGTTTKYDVIDLQFHRSADFLDQWRALGEKILFTPMESVARNLVIDMSMAFRGKSGITLRRLLASAKAAAEEIVFASKANQVVCVSRTDASFLKLLCKSKKITYLDTAISSLEFADAIDSIGTPLHPEEKDKTIVYVAYFGSETNVVALRWYLQQVHPLVLEKVPDYKLQVVGRGDLSEFYPFASDAVELVGEVPSLAPHISEARVGIAPSLGGSGFRGKVNQYAVFGVPSVISSNSAKGLDYKDSIDIFIADAAEHFAEKCARLLIDDELNQIMGERARTKAVALYSWESKLDQIRSIYSLEKA